MLLKEQLLLFHDLISRDVAAKFVMILSLINVIICFYPSYTLTHVHSSSNSTMPSSITLTNTTISTGGSTDDYVGNFASTTVIYGASLSCLMISIPSACDCVIDMIPQWIVIALFQDRRYSNAQNQAKQHGDDAGIKMTIAERLMFIIGVITLSSATFPDLQVITYRNTILLFFALHFLHSLSCSGQFFDDSTLFLLFLGFWRRSYHDLVWICQCKHYISRVPFACISYKIFIGIYSYENNFVVSHYFFGAFTYHHWIRIYQEQSTISIASCVCFKYQYYGCYRTMWYANDHIDDICTHKISRNSGW